MAAPKFMRKLAILAVIEATVGTLVAPVAVNAIEVSNVSLMPFEGEEVVDEIIKAHFGASESTQVTVYRKVSFDVRFSGVSAKGNLPGITALLRACSASATNTPGTSTVFAPITDNPESLTIFAVIDKGRYKMAGARGEAKATVDAQGVPKWSFEFTGAFLPVEDVVSMPASDTSGFLKALPVTKENSTLSLDGIAVACSAFSFATGNTVEYDNLMGVEGTEITGRVSTGSVTFRMTDVATKDWVGRCKDRAKVPLALVHGQADTNKVKLTAARAELGKPSFAERKGIQMITIPLRFIPSGAGNDEWAIEI